MVQRHHFIDKREQDADWPTKVDQNQGVGLGVDDGSRSHKPESQVDISFLESATEFGDGSQAQRSV